MIVDTRLRIDRKQERPLHRPERCRACKHECERDSMLTTPERGEYLCHECGIVCACGCGHAFEECEGWWVDNGFYRLLYAKPCAEAIWESDPDDEVSRALDSKIRAWRQSKSSPLGEVTLAA